MRIDVLTLFPSWFGGVLGDSILKRAQDRGVVRIACHDFREYTHDRHRQVDDIPYGGGPGMVLKPEPVAAALDAIAGPPASPSRAWVVYTSPSGTPFTQRIAEDLARCPHLVVLCGHYEGLDQRVIDSRVDEELSLGDFVLTGGEIAAMAIVDAVARLVPGVLSNSQSAVEESYTSGVLEGPQYTRPEVWEDRRVPPVLLSGHHGNIARWRAEERIRRTRDRRPDLLCFAPEEA